MCARLKLNEPLPADTRDPYWEEICSQREREDPDAPWDRVTYRVRRKRRTPSPSERLTQHLLQFTNALRAAANLWHNTLTQADRDFWKAVNADRDGARPNMLTTFANGWNLFAMFALAPLIESAPAAWTPPQPEGTPADDIIFFKADSAAQLLRCINYQTYFPAVGNANIIFIHQVDPTHVGRIDATRRTIVAGYHTITPTSDPVEGFAFPPPYPFAAGDQVSILIREHVSILEVNNRLRTLTAD